MAAKSGSRKKSGGTRSGDAAAKGQSVAELKNRIAVLENELRLRNDSFFSGTVRGGQPGAAPGESEEKFRAIFDRAAIGLAISDPTGLIIDCNSAYVEMLGYGKEELRKMRYLDFTHPDDVSKNRDFQRRMNDGLIDRYQFEKRYMRKDGSVIWCNVVASAIRSPDGSLKFNMAVIEDITRRRQAEERAAYLASYPELNPNPIFEVGVDGNVGYANPSTEKVFPGLMAMGTTHPILEGFSEIVDGFKPGKSSVVRDVEFHGAFYQQAIHFVPDRKVVRFYNVDITGRKQAEEALRASEEKFRQMAENTGEVLFTFSPDWKRTVYVSPAYERVWGRPLEDVYRDPMDWLDGVHPEDRGLPLAVVHRNAGGDVSGNDRVEFRLVRQDESVRWIFARTFPIRDEHGRLSGITGIAEDITERRRAEEELRESKERFQALADNIPNLAWMANADGWIFWYNKQWYDYTGTTPEEMRGWGWQKVHHPDYVKAVTEEWSTRIEEGKPYDNIFPLRGKDGNYRWFLTRVTPIKDENGKIQRWFGTNTDITDRKRDEEEHRITADFLKIINKAGSTDELVRSAAKFLQEQSGCEVLGIRLKQGEDYPYYIARGFPAEFLEQENHLCARGEDGRTVYDRNGLPVYECVCGNVISGRANRSMPFYTARGSFWTNSTSELVEKYGEADLMAKIRGRCVERFESVAVIRISLGGETLGLLHINDPGKGRFSPELIARWELLADQLAVALGKFRAEEALRESEANLARAQRITRLGNWSWDVKGDRVQGSAEFFQLFGFVNRQSIAYGEFIARLHPEDREQVDGAVKAALSDSRPYSVDYRVVPPDGVERVIHAEGEVTRDNAGRPATMFGTVQDITERKKAEKELEEAKSRAELYVDLMGHDINNQNQSAQGFLELALQTLEMDRKIGPGGKVLIEKPLQAIENSSRLISNVRKLQKLADEGVKARPVDLHDLFGELEALDYRFGDRGAAIHIHEAPHCTVNGSDLLRDVFFNLISNAVKHARPEGPVIVDVKAEPVNQEGRAYCRCTVEDNGPGVPDDLKPKLFHRFQRGETKAHGKGLGLYLVRSLVESYGGKVWVEDRVKGDHTKGARFVVMLPAVE